jgi:hypothetical protein
MKKLINESLFESEKTNNSKLYSVGGKLFDDKKLAIFAKNKMNLNGAYGGDSREYDVEVVQINKYATHKEMENFEKKIAIIKNKKEKTERDKRALQQYKRFGWAEI